MKSRRLISDWTSLSRAPPCARLEQVADLRQAGLEPYAYRFDRTHYTSELQVGAGGQGGKDSRGINSLRRKGGS